jgi:hypothetical protein
MFRSEHNERVHGGGLLRGLSGLLQVAVAGELYGRDVDAQAARRALMRLVVEAPDEYLEHAAGLTRTFADVELNLDMLRYDHWRQRDDDKAIATEEASAPA